LRLIKVKLLCLFCSVLAGLARRIIENDLFKHDWRSRSNVEVLQYIFLKWAMAFLVGLLTGVIASLINLAIENISGLKMLHMVNLVREKRYWAGFLYFAGVNFALTFVAALLCVVFAPTAAGPGIPEIKAYLNGVDTPNMFGAPQLIVKVKAFPFGARLAFPFLFCSPVFFSFASAVLPSEKE